MVTTMSEIGSTLTLSDLSVGNKMGIHDHIGLELEPHILCITGSKEHNDLWTRAENLCLFILPRSYDEIEIKSLVSDQNVDLCQAWT